MKNSLKNRVLERQRSMLAGNLCAMAHKYMRFNLLKSLGRIPQQLASRTSRAKGYTSTVRFAKNRYWALST